MFMIISINKNLFKVKTVLSNKDIQLGMMGRTFSDFDGMFFILDKSEHCFWMKNCIIPLDIIFINDSQITKIHHSCPPCVDEMCRNYCGFGDIVLELPSDTCKSLNISENDRVKFMSPF